MGFPGDSVIQNPLASAGDAGEAGSIPGSGSSPGGRIGNPLQNPCLGKFHVQSNLVWCNPWGLKELDTTERMSTHIYNYNF